MLRTLAHTFAAMPDSPKPQSRDTNIGGRRKSRMIQGAEALSLAWLQRYDGCMTRDLDQVFAALADPTRRAILAMLLEDDMAVTDVAEPFDMSLAAISKHLGVLSVAGLISQEKRGRVKWCKLEPDAMRKASIWMQGFGQFEPINLDAFERFLAQEMPAIMSDKA